MGMTDDFEMRMRLQQVAAYRDLCRRVRRSGRGNIFFASIMLFLAYVVFRGGAAPLLLSIYVILAAGELFVGLFKWLAPSAEGVLLDGLVLIVFAAYNFGMEYLRFQRGIGPNLVVIFLSLYMLSGAMGSFKSYRVLRLLFSERPTAEHLAWFDDLVREIKTADPQTDELALDLPTKPHWKAKLLGAMAVFAAARGDSILIMGADDFEVRREPVDHGTGRRKAMIRIFDQTYPGFEITDASWANYQNWRAAHPLPVISTGPGS
jgi:hypothetical protein